MGYEKLTKEFVKRSITLVQYLISTSRIMQPNTYQFFSSLWEVQM
jgi:hypothetical protein